MPMTPSDRIYKKVSVSTSGSLDYGRGAFAGTTGHNGFDKKYRAVL
jgi:hypothetical protein